MSEKRKIGGAAAIGPAIALAAAACVLLAALPATRADELPGQRANSQLSQLRIDQPPPDQAPGAPPDAPRTSGSATYGSTTYGSTTYGSTTYGTTAAPAQPSAAGSFPRSFQLPGTSTSIRVGGSIDESFHSRLEQ